MTEAEWLVEPVGFRMSIFLDGTATSRQFALFCCACLRRVWSLMPDDRVRACVEVHERMADGLAGHEDLVSAWRACQAAFQTNDVRVWRSSGRVFKDIVSNMSLMLLFHEVSEGCQYAVEAAFLESLGDDSALYTDDLKAQAKRAASEERIAQTALAADIFGNPFRPVTFLPEWRTPTVLALAQQMYDFRDFSAMPILADSVQDAGCEDESLLGHCRVDGCHVRGCAVIDAILGKS